MAAGDYLDSTKNAVFIPEVIANQTLGALGSYLNLGRTVTKDSELTTEQVGAVISVPRRGAVSSNALAENGSVVVQSPTADDVQVTLDHHQEVTIGELDFTRSLQPGSTLPGYVTDGIIALAEDIETLLAQQWSDLSATFNIDATSDPQKDLVDGRTQMVKNKVPRIARKYAYLDPDYVGKLLKQEAFIDPKLIPNNNALTEGAVGRVAGFDVFEGQLVSSSGSPKTYRNMLYTRNALVLATRPQPLPDPGTGAIGSNVIDDNGIALQVVKSYNSNKLGNQITIHVVFGANGLDTRQGGVIDHRP